jgi:hypothetical protein
MSASQDSLVSEFSKRLLDRKLFKAIDVRERVKQIIDPNPTTLRKEATEQKIEKQIDIVCEAISEKIKRKNVRRAIPRILLDREQRRPYKDIEESKGPLNQILIKQPDDRLIDLVECSQVVRSIKTFKLFRLYIDGNDSESRSYVEKLIKEEVNNVKKT